MKELWLVKSSNKIHGPYLKDELIQKLKSREFVLLDEMSLSGDRWIYIRDEPRLSEVVKELRSKMTTHLIDDSTTRAAKTQTLSQTLSVAGSDSFSDDRTEDFYSQSPEDSYDNKASSHHANYAQTVKEASSHHSRSSAQASSASHETFVFSGDQAVAHEGQTWRRWVWSLTFFVVLGSGAFYLFRQNISKPIQNKAIHNESIERGFQSLAQGQDYEALQHFKRAHQIDPQNSSFYLPLSLLMLRYERQTVLPRRWLNQLLAEQEKERHKILTALGLVELADEKWAEADSRFLRALDVDSLFKPALINLGITALQMGDAEKANNYLQIAIKDGAREGLERLLLSFALLRLSQKDNDKSYLELALKYLQEIRPQQAYYFESLVAQIYIYFNLQQTQKILPLIDVFLNTDPYSTEEQKKDLYIYHRYLGWSQLSQWCLQATEKMDPLARVISFEALCLLKNNQLQEASRKIEDAVQQSPRDALVQATYGVILTQAQILDKAELAFEKAIEFDQQKQWITPLLGMSRLCEKMNKPNCEKYLKAHF